MFQRTARLSNATSGVLAALRMTLARIQHIDRFRPLRSAAPYDARAEEPILQELRSPECTDQAIEAACELKSERFLRELERLLEADPDAEHIRLAIDAILQKKPAL